VGTAAGEGEIIAERRTGRHRKSSGTPVSMRERKKASFDIDVTGDYEKRDRQYGSLIRERRIGEYYKH